MVELEFLGETNFSTWRRILSAPTWSGRADRDIVSMDFLKSERLVSHLRRLRTLLIPKQLNTHATWKPGGHRSKLTSIYKSCLTFSILMLLRFFCITRLYL